MYFILGVWRLASRSSQEGDISSCDECVNGYIYFMTVQHPLSNAPELPCNVITFRTDSIGFQFGYGYWTGKMYMRGLNGGTWSNWKEL